MSEKKIDLNIDIDEGTAKWRIDSNGPINGTYRGVFTFRCVLNPEQWIAADRDYRSILGVNPSFADSHSDNMAYALAQLKYRIIKSPPFWEGDTLYHGGHIEDTNIIDQVLKAAEQAELQFRDEVKDRDKDIMVRLKKQVKKMEDDDNKTGEDEEEEKVND